MRNFFSATYHPQSNGHVERFNRAILSALRKYIGDYSKDWVLFSVAVTFAYNTQVHRTTNIAPFELVLARAPKSLALQAQPHLEQFSCQRAYYLKWKSWLESFVRTADKSLRKEEAKYKRNFGAMLRKPQFKIPVDPTFNFARSRVLLQNLNISLAKSPLVRIQSRSQIRIRS